MTFKDLINELSREVDIASKLFEESKDPSKNEFKNHYFFLLSQKLAIENKVNVERELKTIENFLKEHSINENDDTFGIEYYLLKRNRL